MKMAIKSQRKPSATKSNVTEVHQPAWRQPPARSRSRMRRQQALAERLSIKSVAQLIQRRPDSATQAAGRATGKAQRARLQVHLNWRVLVALPLLALIVFGVTRVFTGYEFYVYDADIRGNQRVPAETIYAASGVDTKNILWVNPRQVERQVAALPGIASARVNIQPPHKVIIQVQERTPLVAWQTPAGTVWLDAEGTNVPAVGEPPKLTLIDDAGAAGQDGKLLPSLLAAIRDLHAQQPALTALRYGAKEGLYFQAPEGWTVYLGSDGNMAARLALLQATQARIAAQSSPPSVVDLRVEGNAYLR